MTFPSSDKREFTLDRRGFLSLGAMLGAGVVLSGCGGGTDAPPGAGGDSESKFGTGDTYDGPAVTLAFWNGFTGGDGPFMRQMVEAFNSEQSNITVEMNVLQWADYYQKVPNAVSAGSGPDVGIMHIDQLATNAARRVILPLDEVADGLELSEDDFNTVVWDAGVYKDQRYGIPLDVHPLGMFYNKTLLEQAGLTEAPTDRESFEQALEAMKAAGTPNPFWQTATWPAHLQFTSYLHQFGGRLYNEEGTQAEFASDAGVEALTWMVSHVEKGNSPRDVSNDAQVQGFRQQSNAIELNGIWMMNEWDKVDGLEWAAAPFPKIGDEEAVWGSSHNFVVFKQRTEDVNKLQASRAFIAYISERSIQWAESGQVPARDSVRESPEFEKLEVQSTLAQQLDHVVYPPAVAGIGDVTSPTFETAVNEAVLLRKEPKAALEEAQSKANDLLEENREKYGD